MATRTTAKGKPTESEEPAPVEDTPRHGKKKKKERTQQETTSSTHTIVAGETLYAIARKNGITVEELKKSNNLTSDNLQPGQKIQITKATKGHQDKEKSHSSKRKRRGRH